MSIAALVHAVYTEYARYLRGLGLEKAAYFFAGKVGPQAKQLLDGFWALTEVRLRKHLDQAGRFKQKQGGGGVGRFPREIHNFEQRSV